MYTNQLYKTKYRLKDLKNGLFQVHSKFDGAYEGTPTIIFHKAKQMGINPLELKRAVDLLNREDKHAADFDGDGNLVVVWKTEEIK
jgi:hypothetical protein